MKTLYAPVAQLVEQLPFKERVEGSIPPGRTKRDVREIRNAGRVFILKTRSIFLISAISL